MSLQAISFLLPLAIFRAQNYFKAAKRCAQLNLAHMRRHYLKAWSLQMLAIKRMRQSLVSAIIL